MWNFDSKFEIFEFHKIPILKKHNLANSQFHKITILQNNNFLQLIKVYANQMGSDENLQDKLVDLDAQIRSRKEEIEDMDKNEASIVAQMEKNLEILDEIERNGESALEKPAEYLVAKNVVESIDPTYIRNKELYNQLEAKVKSVLYPPGTLERVQNVELDLDKAELELSRAEVHKVDLSGQTILDAREAVIKIYEVLVEVKNNLEDLIRIKRELTKNDFLQGDADLSSKLVGLRERFNKTGDRITQNKATLSKSLRRVQKLKKALDETDQWASEVNLTSKIIIFFSKTTNSAKNTFFDSVWSQHKNRHFGRKLAWGIKTNILIQNLFSHTAKIVFFGRKFFILDTKIQNWWF